MGAKLIFKTNNMKKYLTAAALLTCFAKAEAQQLQSSSLYEVQAVIHDPSMAGVIEQENSNALIGADYRSQWSNISGAPQTVTVFGSFNLPKQKIGVGTVLYNDKTGPTSRSGVVLNLAKHIEFNDGGIFSLGLETRFLQYRIDRGALTDILGADPAIGSADSRVRYDAGFGMSYTNKHFQVGASAAQLVQSKLGFEKSNASADEQAMLYRHYYFHGKYTWNVDGSTRIIPNVLVIYLPNAPVELQGGARIEFKKLLWWGVGYRMRQGVMLSAGLHLKHNVSFSYAYDAYRTPISSYDAGHSAHEAMLSFGF